MLGYASLLRPLRPLVPLYFVIQHLHLSISRAHPEVTDSVTSGDELFVSSLASKNSRKSSRRMESKLLILLYSYSTLVGVAVDRIGNLEDHFAFSLDGTDETGQIGEESTFSAPLQKILGRRLRSSQYLSHNYLSYGSRSYSNM
jgi:hypothetical protein